MRKFSFFLIVLFSLSSVIAQAPTKADPIVGHWIYARFLEDKPMDKETKTMLNDMLKGSYFKINANHSYETTSGEDLVFGTWKTDKKTISMTTKNGVTDKAEFDVFHKDSLLITVLEMKMIMYRNK
jgi:hypothetical protein